MTTERPPFPDRRDYIVILAGVLPHVIVEDNGCWSWPRGHNDQYSTIRVRGDDGRRHMYLVHRLWIQARGTAAGREAHHRCLNKGCVNPAHIVSVTAKQHRVEHARIRHQNAA